MKELSIDVVNTVMEFLILTFGKTTSLDVKLLLRKLGFEAKQAEVSTYMQQIAEDWSSTYAYEIDNEEVELVFETTTEKGKSFRVYSFKPVVADELDDLDDLDDVDFTAAPVGVNVPARSIKDIIRANPNKTAKELAGELGISSRSVGAFRANLNR